MIEIEFYSLTTVPIQQFANSADEERDGLRLATRPTALPHHELARCNRNECSHWRVGNRGPTRHATSDVQYSDERLRKEDRRHQHSRRSPPSVLVRTSSATARFGCGRHTIVDSGRRSDHQHVSHKLRRKADLAVKIGMDVFVLGYPFGADPPGFPVWKRGSIASEPHLTRPGPGYMLVDTASRPGMSGAPVIRRSRSQHFMEDGTNRPLASNSLTRFIVVYSGRLHTKDPSDAQIGMVWPAEDIEEIIGGAKLDEG
jgi:hypothetical protein